jgi:hypothetical protein
MRDDGDGGESTFVSANALYVIVSEGLRTPLLRLQLLSEDPKNIEQINSEASTLLRMLDCISFIDRGQRSQAQLQLEPVNMAGCYDDSIQRVLPYLTARGISVENRISKQPVLASREAVSYLSDQLLHAMGEIIASPSGEVLSLKSRSTNYQNTIGIYSSGLRMRAREFHSMQSSINRALTTTARCPELKHLHIYAVDALARLQGSRLRSSIFAGGNGLAISLEKSRQLAMQGI